MVIRLSVLTYLVECYLDELSNIGFEVECVKVSPVCVQYPKDVFIRFGCNESFSNVAHLKSLVAVIRAQYADCSRDVNMTEAAVRKSAQRLSHLLQ